MKKHISSIIGALLCTVLFAGGLSAQALQITNGTLLDGRVGTAYAVTFNATGGTPPYVNWAQPSGTLPNGLTLNASSGVLDGTTTTAGTFDFVIRVTDNVGGTATKAFTIKVAATLAVTTTTLPDGRIGTAYAAPALAATGGIQPYSWSIVNGALPAGLSLAAGTGVISGTPTVGGSYTFTVRATDTGNPQQTANQSLTLKIPPSITTTSLPNGLLNTAYSQTLTAAPTTATPLTWSISAGALPTGITLTDPANGVLSGTPTAAGTFNFTVLLTDSVAQTTTKDLSIIVQSGLTITTVSPMPQAVATSFYIQILQATGPTPQTWTVSLGVLPPGLSLQTNGTLSGTPSSAGTYDFTVQVATTNPTQTATKDLRIVVNPQLLITTAAALPAGVVNTAYNFTLSATGGVGPYTWSVPGLGLPAGVTLSSAGVLSGTPTTTGNFSFQAQVTDSFTPTQTTTRQFSLTVSSGLTITTNTLANGAVGIAYSRTLTASGGTLPLTWGLSGGILPSGVGMTPDGVISGTPLAAGTFSFTATVSDSSSPPQSGQKALSITIQPLLSITTSSTLPVTVVGTFFSQLLEATGPTPITWSIVAGIAPPGLVLTLSGNLGGTPTAAGTFEFTAQANAVDPPQNDRRVFRMTVNPALTINTPASLPDAVVGVPYSQQVAVTGGVQPYTFTSQGRGLPPGLALSSSGLISGTPVGVGVYAFTIQVNDSSNPPLEAVRNFQVSVATALSITTVSLPNAIQNSLYSQQLQAMGTGPFVWVLSAGTLPAGVSMGGNGLILGTPTAVGSQTFTVTLTDGRGSAVGREFTIVVDPPIPAFSVRTIPATLPPTQSSSIELTLATPHPSALSGTLRLTFTSTAEVPVDDPMTQFSNGLRTSTFTIPANITTASFPTQLTLLT